MEAKFYTNFTTGAKFHIFRAQYMSSQGWNHNANPFILSSFNVILHWDGSCVSEQDNNGTSIGVGVRVGVNMWDRVSEEVWDQCDNCGHQADNGVD